MEQSNKKESSIVIYLKNLSKKDKIILSSTVILVALAISLRFVILPQLDKYLVNLDTLDKVRAEQSKALLVPKENQLLAEKLDTVNIEYENALNGIPNTPSVAQIIYDLEYLVDKNYIELSSLSFSEGDVTENQDVTTDENGVVTDIDRGVEGGEMPDQTIQSDTAIKKQVVNMSIKGEYKNILDFIKDIENYSRIAEVSNISISTSSDEILSASLTANFYNFNYEEKESYEFNDGTYGKENSFN